MLYPYPEYRGHGRTELTEVPGMGMDVLHVRKLVTSGEKDVLYY